MARNVVFTEGFDYSSSDVDYTYRGWIDGGGGTVVTGRHGTGYALQQPSPWTHLMWGNTFSECTFGMALYWNGSANGIFMNLCEGAVAHLKLGLDGGYVVAYRSTTVIATATTQQLKFGWNYIECYYKCADSGGRVKVKVNELATDIDFTGDTRNANTGVINTFYIIDNLAFVRFDDIYILTNTGEDFLGDIQVLISKPNGNGSKVEWTPSTGTNYQNVNGATIDGDTTYNWDATAGHGDLFTFSDFNVTGTVYALGINAYMRKDDAGARSIGLLAYPGVAIYTGTVHSAGDTYSFVTDILLLNPDTAGAWTIPTINASEFGIVSET